MNCFIANIVKLSQRVFIAVKKSSFNLVMSHAGLLWWCDLYFMVHIVIDTVM